MRTQINYNPGYDEFNLQLNGDEFNADLFLVREVLRLRKKLFQAIRNLEADLRPTDERN